VSQNFVEFSEVIPDVTAEETAWLLRQTNWEDLQAVVADLHEKFPVGPVPDEEVARCDLALLPAWLAGDMLDFGAEPDKDGNFWIYAEEYGDPEAVATVVQTFLDRFRPEQSWILEWSSYCNNLRIGGFGGGAVLVTAEKIEWFLPLELAMAAQAKFEKALA